MNKEMIYEINISPYVACCSQILLRVDLDFIIYITNLQNIRYI